MSKRKSDQFLEIDDESLQEQVENLPVTVSCDAVRRKVRAFIDSGEMKVGEFQKAIGASSVSYSRFMSQNGASKGAGSNVYIDAYQFFKKREIRGIKMPSKKAKTTKDAASAVPDVSSVTLDGEDSDSVELYDTCNEIRRKISAHLKKPGVVQAQFLREISAQYHQSVKKITSKQLNEFRSKKGPTGGNMSAVFYGAYVYFEKLRIKEGKPKSKTRIEMEERWSRQGGIRTDRSLDRVWAHASDSVTQDKYGQINVIRGPLNPFRGHH